MELWIRSQDEETLIKCEKIMIKERDNTVAILNYIDVNSWFRLGLYETKERALEVLDEIQGLFMKKEITNTEVTKDGLTMYSKQLTSIVYTMPKE